MAQFSGLFGAPAISQSESTRRVAFSETVPSGERVTTAVSRDFLIFSSSSLCRARQPFPLTLFPHRLDERFKQFFEAETKAG
jgi:hypothetical protein